MQDQNKHFGIKTKESPDFAAKLNQLRLVPCDVTFSLDNTYEHSDRHPSSVTVYSVYGVVQSLDLKGETAVFNSSDPSVKPAVLFMVGNQILSSEEIRLAFGLPGVESLKRMADLVTALRTADARLNFAADPALKVTGGAPIATSLAAGIIALVPEINPPELKNLFLGVQLGTII